MFFALPVAVIVLRAGAGCIASLAVLCVGGAISTSVIAWGTPIMLGIVLSIPVYFSLLDMGQTFYKPVYSLESGMKFPL